MLLYYSVHDPTVFVPSFVSICSSDILHLVFGSVGKCMISRLLCICEGVALKLLFIQNSPVER